MFQATPINEQIDSLSIFRFAMMEEKIILSSILRRFDILPHRKLANHQDLKLLAELVLRPKCGLHVFVRSRSMNKL